MNWNPINKLDQLDEVSLESFDQPVIIYKHSSRCMISSMALSRLERSWDEAAAHGTKPYFLDLIRHRDISNAVAEKFGIDHESPQIILLKDGQAVYNDSHTNISFGAVMKALTETFA